MSSGDKIFCPLNGRWATEKRTKPPRCRLCIKRKNDYAALLRSRFGISLAAAIFFRNGMESGYKASFTKRLPGGLLCDRWCDNPHRTRCAFDFNECAQVYLLQFDVPPYLRRHHTRACKVESRGAESEGGKIVSIARRPTKLSESESNRLYAQPEKKQ